MERQLTINKHLFYSVYQECCAIIQSTQDIQVRKKKGD